MVHVQDDEEVLGCMRLSLGSWSSWATTGVPSPGVCASHLLIAMHRPLLPSLLLHLLSFRCPTAAAFAPPSFQPLPLLVSCSDPHGRVYRRQDNELWVSCLWDGAIQLRYRPAPGAIATSREGQTELLPPPRCRWYRDTAWVQDTSRWSGWVVLGPGLARGSPAPPWASSRITVQCVSASCTAPTCLHRNLSIEVSGQDVRLFLLWPQGLPIQEWQPVQLGWCARLKSSRWHYRFSSHGSSPPALLIPSNQHHEPPPASAYPRVEMHQACASYYSYHLTVRYHRPGLYIVSVSIEQGPPIRLSLSLRVEPALLHVLSIHSKMLSVSQQPLSLSWELQTLGPRTLAYSLLDLQGTGNWSTSYNPFAWQSNFCALPTSRKLGEMLIASIYFHVDGDWLGEMEGELSLSGAALSLKTSSQTPVYITLKPKKTKMGIYIFSQAHGLYYITQENEAGAPSNGSSIHYVLFQQQNLSYLLTVEFVKLQWYKFNMHLYLNRQGALFRSLLDRDIEVHVFNSTHSFLQTSVYIVWFIPVQHPMLQCEWTFNLQVFGSKKEQLIQNSTYTYSDHVKNAAHFVQRSVLPFNPAQYTGFVARVDCIRSGLTPAVLKVTVNNYASKVIESLVSCQRRTCSLQTVQIKKPDLPDPVIRGRREVLLTLFIILQTNCTGGLARNPRWQIYAVPDMTTEPDLTAPLDTPMIRNKNMVFLPIPKHSLDIGLYLIIFSINITSIVTSQVLSGSDRAYLRMESGDLVANIRGGSFRTVGYSDEWTLDGSSSQDPDSSTGLEGITFTWYCSKHAVDYVNMQLSETGACHPDQVDLKWINSSGPIQTVLPETLPGNARYHFRLVIEKGGRNSSVDQTVSVQSGRPPRLNVVCLENCGRIVIPTDRFTLSGKCLNCRTTSQLVYRWSLLSERLTEKRFDWASKTSTGRFTAYLSINALSFVNIADQSYTLVLKITTGSGASSVSRYSFYVNSAPRIGRCTINPTEGIAFQTTFIVQCSGFSDRNLPLTYKVIAASDSLKTSKITTLQENSFGTIVYFGYEPKSPPSFLPIGIPFKNYALTIYIQISDSLGAFSQVSLQATVQDPTENKPPEVVLNELLALTSGSDAPMTSFLQTGDFFNAGYLVYMVASLLNDVEDALDLQVSKAEFRESLLNISIGISTASIMEVNQVTACISQITEEISEVNVESQRISVNKLSEVGEALKRHRKGNLGSEEAELLTAGVLTGLSNVLRASINDVNVNVVKQSFSIMEDLADVVLQGKVPGKTETLMESQTWNMTLKKDEKWDVASAFSARKDCQNCFYPTLKQEDHSELPIDAVISTVLYEFEENPFPWLGHPSDITTMVTGFKMMGAKANGDTIGIVPEVAEMMIARKDKDSAAFQLTIGPDKTLPQTTGRFAFEVNRNASSIYIQILTRLKVSFEVLLYADLNVSHDSPIASFTASPKFPTSGNNSRITDCVIQTPNIICLSPALLRETAPGSGANRWNVSVVLQTSSIIRKQNSDLVKIALFNAECLDLDGVQSQWEGDSCTIGPKTNWERVHCICKMKPGIQAVGSRMIPGSLKDNIKFLAAKVLVIPNIVDLERSLLENIPRNPVTLLTVAFIFLVYCLLAIWAMRKDRADKLSRDRVIVLPDNDPFDKVCFLVTLYTGSRFGAGTTADVFLQLIGQRGVSDVHCLQHPNYPSLLRGGTDTVLLTTKNYLGDIYALRVWHNNAGSSPDWFLSRVKVENMYTREFWLFICRKWLALGKEDHLLDRTFVVTNQKVPLLKKDYFLINFANDLIDNHIWFSVFSQVVTGSFNRLQRLSCCLAGLLLTLLINIMFFNVEKNEDYSIEIRYLRSIATGIESALVIIPVQIIITALFKYSQKEPPSQRTEQKPTEESSPFMSENLRNWRERLQKWYLSETSARSASPRSLENPSHSGSPYSSQDIRKEKKQRKSNNWSNCAISEGAANAIAAEEEQVPAESTREPKTRQNLSPNTNFSNNYAEQKGNGNRKERRPLNIPYLRFRKRPEIIFSWWCIYVSWALIIAVVGVSSFFIVLYGLSYGYQTSLEWLVASITSFLESVLLFQTLKIVLLSALSAIRPKYCVHIPWSTRENYLEIKLDEVTMDADEMREMHYKLVKARGSKQYQPLEEDEIAIMLKREMIKNKAFIFLKDTISHFIFLTLVLNIAYSEENTNSFYYNQVTHKQFSLQLSNVAQLEHIYLWVNNVFLPLIHNDNQPTFLSDSWSKILGLPRMRQVRAKSSKKKCFHPDSFVNKFVISESHCLPIYGSDPEEKGDHVRSWTEATNKSVSSDASSYAGFTYQSNTNQWTYFSYGELHTYGPGGYTFYFFPEEQRPNSTKRLEALQNSSWLDEETWAVIVELTTFNPDIHLFCSISIIFEVSYFGLLNTSLSVHSFTLPIFRHLTKIQMLGFLAVPGFLFIYIADEIHMIYQKRKDYIKNVSNLINFSLKSVLFVFVALQIIKFMMAEDIVKFYLLHPYNFIPFHAVSHVDQTLRITLGFLAFLIVLKTLRYSRFFYDVRLAQRSILAALPGICSMALVVAVYFFVYMAFGYLAFGQHEWNYNNMIHSAQTIFSYCVSAFEDTEFTSNRLLGGLFLASFMLVMICVLINLFQAVIMSAYEDMKQPVYEEPSDEAEVVTFLVHKMRRIWYYITCRTPSTSDPDLFHSILYGQPERRNYRHLGLKTKKINGKKMVYLVI